MSGTASIEFGSAQHEDKARATGFARYDGQGDRTYHLVERLPPDDLFASDAELVELAGMRKARRLFSFDDWQPVKGAAPLSKSPDMVAMAAALENGAPIIVLPGKPSGGWTVSLGRVLRCYGKREKDSWP